MSAPGSRGDASPAATPRRWRSALAALYLLALIASHLWTRGWEPPLAPGQQRVAIQSPAPMEVAWRSWPSPSADAPVVVLIHGSPGDGRAMDGLAAALPDRYRRLAPDLPGFGASSPEVPDYGVAAHGAATLAWMTAIGIPRAHLVVHSMGGGVALSMADQAPERVSSITLIAAIGVVELELLGGHAVNHAIHGAQLAAIWALHHGLPHFGLLGHGGLDLAYARNFYDTDQRPLRGVLSRYAGPMLVLHGQHDFLVPAAAAEEHARLVPQARLVMTDGDHFDLFRDPDGLAAVVTPFLDAVEAGEAPTRAQADPARVAAAAEPFDGRRVPPAMGPALGVLVGLLALGTLVSEDLTCVAGGLLAASGRMSVLAASFGCGLGIFLGDLLLVAAGRLLGAPALRRAPLSWWIRAEAVERAARWYQRNGARVILASRFMPGARLPMYFAAGALRVPLWSFLGWFALAAVVWTPLLVGGTAALGGRAMALLEGAQHGALIGAALIAAGVLTLRTLVPLSTWRGRRLALGWWRRKHRWEFWPMWAYYPPVLLYICGLMLKHRSLTIFTAVNPGMPAGGFIGESKWDFYQRLGGAQNPMLPRTARIPGDAPLELKLALFDAFQAAGGDAWPVVLKPDAGQRGAGVKVVRSRAAAVEYLAASGVDCLAQVYVPGVEYGLFYLRHPAEPRGRIFSVTEKRPLDLIGDGKHTLEELILADERAVCMAPLHLRVHAARLEEVPAAGERVRLVELGTHSRGSVFLDGAAVVTPALEQALDALSKQFEGGFYFGRYDVRAASVEALGRGEFLAIELNGATSEPTHIYDPQHSFFYGQRVLRAQWRQCFEIAAANAAMGATVTPAAALLRAWLDFRAAESRRVR